MNVSKSETRCKRNGNIRIFGGIKGDFEVLNEHRRRVVEEWGTAVGKTT